jgi:NAD(P)-dependent dehydrogenase (short-subunit alcohol dehydrogenase family)
VGGQSVAVFGDHTGLACPLAAGLVDRGSRVALLCPESSRAAAVLLLGELGAASVAVVPCDDGDGSAVAAGLDEAAAVTGSLGGVVDACGPEDGITPQPLAELDHETWQRRAEEPLKRALHRLQGTYRHFRRTGGRMVVLLPSLSLCGAAGLVPWVSAAEGQRAFAKIAARVWGREGVTVNCLAVPAHLLAGRPRGTPTGPLDRPGLPAPSLGGAPDVRADISRVVDHFLDPDLAVLTGQTVGVDGGVWMAP